MMSENKHNKKVLVLIMVVCLGIFMLPATVSLFMGQHMWYATDITSGGK